MRESEQGAHHGAEQGADKQGAAGPELRASEGAEDQRAQERAADGTAEGPRAHSADKA